MAIRELFSSTWEEIRDAAGPDAVAVLPLGAIEAHGPHLPLGTDVIIAAAMARAAAERLASDGRDVLLLPPLHYSPAPFAAAFPGTISLEPGKLVATLAGIAREVARHGVGTLAVANAHLDPAHLEALREAERLVGDAGRPMFVAPDITRRRWAERLTAEFRSGACHAGQYETSIVLAERPELVREALRTALEPVSRSLVTAIREGRRTFEEAGGPRAYFGDPAAASAEEGRRTIEALGRILEEAVLEAASGARPSPPHRGSGTRPGLRPAARDETGDARPEASPGRGREGDAPGRWTEPPDEEVG